MMSKLSAPNLVIVDVGHGNASVLQDTEGIVVFDTGKGPALVEFLRANAIKEVSALVLSHADDDHIGNASRLLLHNDICVKAVIYNSDPTKGTDSQQQLQLAILTARRQRKTKARPGLCSTVTGKLDCGEVRIEVLYPPPEALVTGVGGQGMHGGLHTSNSLSAAIRLWHKGKAVALLGGDVGGECLDFWEEEKLNPAAQILVFPHHGGTPGPADAGQFAERISAKVRPVLVIFSIHRTRFNLPRDDVVRAILNASPNTKLVCTQLPERFVKKVEASCSGPWCLHRVVHQSAQLWWDGHIWISFRNGVGQLVPHGKPSTRSSCRRKKRG